MYTLHIIYLYYIKYVYYIYYKLYIYNIYILRMIIDNLAVTSITMHVKFLFHLRYFVGLQVSLN